MKRKLIQCASNYSKLTTPQEVIYAIKKAGFDGAFVQWFDADWGFDQQKQVDLIKKLGLELNIAHLNITRSNDMWLKGEAGEISLNAYMRNLDECKKNNIKTAILHLSYTMNPPKLSRVGLSRWQKLINYAETLNINIAIENAEVEGCMEYIFKHIKNKNLSVCYDAGHDHTFFKDNFNWEFFKNKISIVHLHDNDTTGDQHNLPYDGTIDWEEIVNKLKLANYNGPIILESLYSPQYANMSVEDFYKLSKQRAEKIRKFFEQ